MLVLTSDLDHTMVQNEDLLAFDHAWLTDNTQKLLVFSTGR